VIVDYAAASRKLGGKLGGDSAARKANKAESHIFGLGFEEVCRDVVVFGKATSLRPKAVLGQTKRPGVQ